MEIIARGTPLVDARAFAVAGLGFAAGAVGWIATGVVGAVPAGIGLAIVAASDLSTHRLSLRVLGVASLSVIVALTLDSAIDASWDRLRVAMLGSAAFGALLAAGWLRNLGLAFGDVLLATFTVVVPLYVSGRAAAVTIGAAAVVAGVVAAAHVLRRGWRPDATVRLGPALLVGWICGVIVG